MTFGEVIVKNLTKNLKKYLSYYYSGTFCVAMFFIYSTLLFMDAIQNADGEYPLQALFLVSCLCIFTFSVIFINYAHHMFVANQKKELGIYMVVGMDASATRKMLAIETTLIGTASILSGMIIGVLFSRFFQIVIQKLLSIDNITYQMKPQSFLLTIPVFVFLYLLCFILTDRKMLKEDLVSILKESHKNEGRSFKKYDLFLLVIGILLMIFSIVFVLSVAHDNHINSSLWVLLTFILSGYIGLFLVICYGVRTFVWLIQKKNDYYSRMLTVSGIHHKFKQNSTVIMILSMLASMIVLLVGSPIALVNMAGDIAEDGSKDLVYLTFAEYDTDQVEKIVAQKEIADQSEAEVHFTIDLTTGEMKPVLSVSEYNRQMQTDLTVEQGQLYHMIITWEPGNHGVVPGETYTIGAGNATVSYQVCESIKGEWEYSNLFPTESILILSDEDYATLEPMLQDARINSVMYVENWRKTQNIVDEVEEELHAELGDAYLVSSTINVYHQLKSGYSVFLFSTCFMCFMFFVSTGCVLYFKQYNEIDDEKEQYIQLYKLGISDSVIKRSISAKLAVVYFLPLLGTIMGIMISYYMASLFGGDDTANLFIRKAFIGVVCYAGSQLLFYLFLRVRYLHDIFQTEI